MKGPWPPIPVAWLLAACLSTPRAAAARATALKRSANGHSQLAVQFDAGRKFPNEETDWKPQNREVVLLPEFRAGYDSYTEEHPEHALFPNGADRRAESSTILTFALMAITMAIATVWALNRFGHLSPEKQAVAVGAAGGVPWALTSGWLARIAVRNIAEPTRSFAGDSSEQWQCTALVWYILLAPALTMVTVAIPLLLALKSREAQAPMGRMLGRSTALAQSAPGLMASSAHAGATVAMPFILCIEVVTVLFGAGLVFFGESNYCQPEVRWAATALAIVTTTVLLLIAILGVCLLAGISAGMPLANEFKFRMPVWMAEEQPVAEGDLTTWFPMSVPQGMPQWLSDKEASDPWLPEAWGPAEAMPGTPGPPSQLPLAPRLPPAQF